MTLSIQTPCEEYDVAGLLDHLAVWVQVFAGAVNVVPVEFDPMEHKVTEGWSAIFAESANGIVSGLREKGFDRPMTMTTDAMPGEFTLSMMLMEYVTHGWDLMEATGGQVAFTEEEAAAGLAAAESIVEPEHREYGMFGAEVTPADGAGPMA